MGDIMLHRKSDSSLIADRCILWTGWTPAYEQPAPKTIAGVRILIKHAVMEFEGTATFVFKGADIQNMYDMWDYGHDLEVLTFTDFGDTYDVRIAETPEAVRLEEYKHFSLYSCAVKVMRVGYRI